MLTIEGQTLFLKRPNFTDKRFEKNGNKNYVRQDLNKASDLATLTHGWGRFIT